MTQKQFAQPDGTMIAYEKSGAGAGPALILVGGTLEHRDLDSETAKFAAFPHFLQAFHRLSL